MELRESGARIGAWRSAGREELRGATDAMAYARSLQVLDVLITLADNDKDGRINYSEFCQMVSTPTAQLMNRMKK